MRVKVFLFAAKEESDNDFHLLLGGDPSGGDPRDLTTETSGLPSPDNSSTPTIQSARDQFKSFFLDDPSNGFQLPSTTHYAVFGTPIPVTVTGSVFFDIDHHPGEVGTGDVVPATVWEIHPVSNIEFPPTQSAAVRRRGTSNTPLGLKLGGFSRQRAG